MGECIDDGWVMSGSEAPLSWWFSAGVVLASARSAGSIFSGWLKSAVDREITSISSYKTS